MSQSPDVTPAVSQLGDSLVQAAMSHRVLFQEMAGFARDESLRFANLRLERNGEALEKIQNCHGLPGLIGVQQEWLRVFMQDYLGQQLRLASAFRGLAHDVAATATETASENIDRMQQDGHQMAEAVSHKMDEMAQEADSLVQQTQH